MCVTAPFSLACVFVCVCVRVCVCVCVCVRVCVCTVSTAFPCISDVLVFSGSPLQCEALMCIILVYVHSQEALCNVTH